MNIKPLADRVLILPAPAEEKTIGHHFASQCLQRMDETAAFIDRVNARGWENRGIVVREQQFISYLIVQGFPRVDDGTGCFGRLTRA